ncbi:hypothetical protein [Kordia sp.]|uniref:hypothetical protein n=1 Tax=Kordia sp. TaxID=1965332 RepID=UPI0025BABD8E|nr:hypothetical protein [Kordia sp.]MCH2194783.1 hypothetical protein [Kordia sp.]
MKRIIHFISIVIIFSSLSLMYAQEPLETSVDVVEVSSNSMPFPEIETMTTNGSTLANTGNSIKLQVESSTSFVCVIAAILAICIIIIISFRIRKNTLKLF